MSKTTDLANSVNPNSISGSRLEDLTVATAKVANGAVSNQKLSSDSVTADKIVDGSITNAEINSSAAISSTKLSYLQSSSATARTVEGVLRERVSIADFGAVAGDPAQAAVNTTAINNAIAYCQSFSPRRVEIFIPAGRWYVNKLTIPDRISLVGEDKAVGGLSREGTQLDFSQSVGVNEKAITIGSRVVLKYLSIIGPGPASAVAAQPAGTIGIYGGEYPGLTYDGLGVGVLIENCGIERFETGIYLSKWSNTIQGSKIIYVTNGIHLKGAVNAFNCLQNEILVGGAQPKKSMIIDGGDGINISNNLFEPCYLGIEILSGTRINISQNYFELSNNGFILVDGTAGLSQQPTVSVIDNFFIEYGSNATGGGRYGIVVRRGYCKIDGNTITRYSASTNQGLRYGIVVDPANDSEFYGMSIGDNQIGAVEPIEFSGSVTYDTLKTIDTPYSSTMNSFWDITTSTLSEPGLRYSSPVSSAGVGNVIVYPYFRNLRLAVSGTLNADIGSVRVGRVTAALNDASYYMNSTFSLGSNLTRGSIVEAENADFKAAAKTAPGLIGQQLFPSVNAGSATSGSILISMTIGEIHVVDLRN